MMQWLSVGLNEQKFMYCPKGVVEDVVVQYVWIKGWLSERIDRGTFLNSPEGYSQKRQ